jgi:hypothetical protein
MIKCMMEGGHDEKLDDWEKIDWGLLCRINRYGGVGLRGVLVGTADCEEI